jgi:hypothetical protein
MLSAMERRPPPVERPEDPRLTGMGQDLRCLLDMLAFEERAHRARPVLKAR